MIIQIGDSTDFAELADKSVNDYVVVVVHGPNPAVAQANGKPLRSILSVGSGDFFHLLPYGQYAADPFPEDEGEGEFCDERDFVFHVTYSKRDEEERVAVVTLRANMDDPISWIVFASINDVEIEFDGPDSLNRDIGEISVVERLGLGWMVKKSTAR